MTARRSLNAFLGVRKFVSQLRNWWLRRRGIEIARSADISLSAKLLPRSRGAITIGDRSTIGPLAILAGLRSDGSVAPITIGERCFIGGNAIIGPGVTVGDGVIIAAGAVVLQAVPSDCVVAGNPARIVRRGISAGNYGRLPPSDPARRSERLETAIRSLLRRTGR
ncbi:hypothetical protein GCM10011515_14880 [Tsuneonella deserti]|uniref:Maltose O-acetyltransferase n=1 Tax=Tsuneonella deserti TaxID=2035528 RepID=A0ABQ1S8G0_9SPHN|nr:hypothetical protein GCM10011515_14880 [Tsuneonella deserti]